MIGRDPRDDGVLQRGVLYRLKGLPPEPDREHDPETLEIVRRGREKLIREYLEKKRRAS